ncbi:MAG TPA: hypothetical protein VFB45_13805 [Pseudolabrys sp.]|nr:hypothetical protein [Pseudolabrys sp.]
MKAGIFIFAICAQIGIAHAQSIDCAALKTKPIPFQLTFQPKNQNQFWFEKQVYRNPALTGSTEIMSWGPATSPKPTLRAKVLATNGFSVETQIRIPGGVLRTISSTIQGVKLGELDRTKDLSFMTAVDTSDDGRPVGHEEKHGGTRYIRTEDVNVGPCTLKAIVYDLIGTQAGREIANRNLFFPDLKTQIPGGEGSFVLTTKFEPRAF